MPHSMNRSGAFCIRNSPTFIQVLVPNTVLLYRTQDMSMGRSNRLHPRRFETHIPQTRSWQRQSNLIGPINLLFVLFQSILVKTDRWGQSSVLSLSVCVCCHTTKWQGTFQTQDHIGPSQYRPYKPKTTTIRQTVHKTHTMLVSSQIIY